MMLKNEQQQFCVPKQHQWVKTDVSTKSTEQINGVFPKCFTDENSCHYSKRTRSCHLLCERPGCYDSASKTHVRDRISKLRPFHASVIYRIP